MDPDILDTPWAWRVLRCQASTELAVAHSLFESGFEVFCPRYQVKLRKSTREVPFFRSYVFARFNVEDAYVWHQVFDTKGVQRLLYGIVHDNEISRIVEFIGSDGFLKVDSADQMNLSRFEIGMEVRINQGAFTDFIGTIATINNAKLQLGINIYLFGRLNVINQPPSWCDILEKLPRTRKKRRRRHRGRGGKASASASA